MIYLPEFIIGVTLLIICLPLFIPLLHITIILFIFAIYKYINHKKNIHY